MARRSIADRYDRLDRLGDELAGLPANVSPVHVRTVDVLTELMEMGEKLSTKDTPPPLRTLMGLLRRTRPLMLEQLAGVPPETVKEFMVDLVEKMQSIIDTESGSAGADTRTA